MSFLKYQDDPRSQGRGNVSFSRAHLDGMPFRGQPAMLREDEITQASETVHDVQVGLFDLSNPEHLLTVQSVADKIANGWFKLLFLRDTWAPKPDGGMTLIIALMWSEPHKEINRNKLPGRAF